ncbi:DUF3761 domain-containing protein, partial [Gluconacetobacter sacchari]|uniref:DUF3761 domain-containing protein n=1 Tax=Gluconacetobacter sacchari TaxID=92759 RepID=UPI0039B4D005
VVPHRDISARVSRVYRVSQKTGRRENTDHDTVHSPAHSVNGQIPTGAVARCGDGSYSFTHHARGTCSHHHGVVEWIAEP